MNKYIIEKLKEGRSNANLKQSEVAKKLGVKANTLSNYENGVSEPDIDTFCALCDIYKLDPSDILGEAYGLSVQGESFKIKPSEIDHIKKYRNLDPHGKEIIEIILQKELERSTAEQKPESKSPSTTAEIIPMRFLSYYQKMASAGNGEFLFSDIPTEVIAVPDTALSRKADFVIGVNGQSMEDTYFDGDKVLVEKTHTVPIGKIGIFVRGNECFIKEAGRDRLISHNEDKEQYPDIIPDERRIDTIGIVLGKVGE